MQEDPESRAVEAIIESLAPGDLLAAVARVPEIVEALERGDVDRAYELAVDTETDVLLLICRQLPDDRVERLAA